MSKINNTKIFISIIVNDYTLIKTASLNDKRISLSIIF
jgi:hypothetical protein